MVWPKKKLKTTTALFLIIVLAISLLAACSGKDPFAEGGTIEAKVKTDKASTVGKASRDGYQLSLPQGALGEDVSLNMTILSAADSENLTPAGFTLLGTPIEVKIEGRDFVRLGQPVSVTIQLPKEQLKGMEKEDVYAAYYYNGQWEYFLPDSVNLKKGTATFTTYHFSLFSFGKLSEREQINNFAKKMAVQSWAQEMSKEEFHAASKDYFDAALKELGVSSSTARDKLILDIITTEDIPDFAATMLSGDSAAINQKLNETIGSAMLQAFKLDPDLFSNAALVTGSAASAAGHFVEGDFSGGLEAIADGLKGAVPAAKIVTAVSEFGAAKVNEFIDGWKDKELEKAYQVYKNGADGEWGYDVSAGDFAQVLAQMKGGYQKFCADAAAEYCKRTGKKPGDLSSQEYDQVIAKAEAALQISFDKRIAAEYEIGSRMDREKEIIAAMKAKGFLKPEYMEKYFDKDENIEQRLSRLYRIRASIVEMIGTEKAREIGEERICGLIAVWIAEVVNQKNAKTASLLKAKAKFWQHLKDSGYVKEGAYGSKDCVWVLVDVIDYEGREEVEHSNQYPYQCEASYARGSYSFTHIYVGDTDNWYDPPMLNGETFASQLTWSTPPDKIGRGEKVSLNLSLAVTVDTQSFFRGSASANAYFDKEDIGPGFGTAGAIDFTDAQDKDHFVVNRDNPTINLTVTANAPMGSAPGERMALITAYFPGVRVGTAYIYELRTP